MAQFRHEQGLKMREYKVKRQELLDNLRANREKHKQEFVETFEGFKAKAEEAAKALLKNVKALQIGDDPISLNLGLVIPQSYESQYDEAIKGFEMEVEDVVEITSDELSRFVMDKWTWKDSFSILNKTYSSVSSARG